MLGAIIGDMVGSVYEGKEIKTKKIPLFNIHNHMTDDSLLTIAVAKILIKHYPICFDDKSIKAIQADLIDKFEKSVQGNWYAGWGADFFTWARTPLSVKKPYNSYGNGSAMRISPVGWLAKSEEEVRMLSKTVTEITHNHPEGLKGAEAMAMCIYLALNGESKSKIKEYVKEKYYRRIDDIDYQELIANYSVDVTCQGSVPEAIYCFLISESFEDAIRNAISIGGDSDTLAAMTGSIAEAFYHKDAVSSFEKSFLYYCIDPSVEVLIKKFHATIGSKKFKNI
jgi:ADP-ribosylglycohydrolase